MSYVGAMGGIVGIKFTTFCAKFLCKIRLQTDYFRQISLVGGI